MDKALSLLLILTEAVPVAFMALMPVVNPIGTAIILLSLTDGIDSPTRRTLAKKIAINTVALLTAMILGGSYLLAFFGISVPIVQLAGGFVLATMGWNLLNQKDPPPDHADSGPIPTSPESFLAKTFYPFTFPITVGPGSVAVALTLSAHSQRESFAVTAVHQAGALIGILGVAAMVYVCFVYSNRLAQRLGPVGTSVLMRLIAFIVVCIGAEISWSGLKTLLKLS